MTSTTFDARSGQPPEERSDPRPDGDATYGHLSGYGAAAAPGDEGNGLSTLDLLRAKAEEVVEFPPYVFENPKATIRFTCATTIEQRQLSVWQRASLPPEERKKRGGVPDLSKLDPIVYFTRAIAATCNLVEVRERASGQYVAITHQRTGEPLTFDDNELLLAMGSPDKVTAVRNAMNKADWAIQKEGTELLARAGYGDPVGDDDEDPQG